MNVSEISQKNCRLKFWLLTLAEGTLSDSQRAELGLLISNYQQLLSRIIKDTSSANGLISEENNLKLVDLERKIEGLAEVARLEAGRSKLLI